MENNCLVTTLKSSVENENLVKMGTISLKAIKDGTFTLVSSLGASHLDVVSGEVSVDGTPIGAGGYDIPMTSNIVTFTCTNGSIVTISNKYVLTMLQSVSRSVELTKGYDLSHMTYMPLSVLALNGDTSGDISALNIPTIRSINVTYSKVTGSIDSLIGAELLLTYNIRETKVTGNLSTLIGKNLNTACHFEASELIVNLADIKNISEGMNSVAKYYNTNLYGDCSSLPASDYVINLYPKNDKTVFTWLTERHNVQDACIISTYLNNGAAGMDFGTYLDAMLLDQAQCSVSESDTTKILNVRGTHTDNSGWQTAVATLKSKGMRVIINGVQQ